MSFDGYHTEIESFGGSLSPSGTVKVDRGPSGKVRGILVNGGGLTYSSGTTTQSGGMVDINGDGLPDFVDGSSVILNLGDELKPVSGKYGEISGMSKGDNESFGVSMSLSTSGSVENSASGKNTGAVSFTLGGSFNYGMSETHSTWKVMDINGDGLPDLVSMVNGDSHADKILKVRFNQGNRFGQERDIRADNWNLVDPVDKNALKDGLDGQLLVGLFGNLPLIGSMLNNLESKLYNGVMINPYVEERYLNNLDLQVSSNAGLGASWNMNMNISIYIPFPINITINIDVASGAGFTKGASLSNTIMQMMDIDGDGLVDRVLRIPRSDKIYIQRNVLQQVGLLKEIQLPQGGKHTLEYGTMLGTADAPGSRQVLTKVITSDENGAGDLKDLPYGVHRYVTAFRYDDGTYNRGYYDRELKEFYGFRQVRTTKYADAEGKIPDTIVDTYYYTGEYYSKGMTRQTVVMNGKEEKLQVSEYVPEKAPRALVKTEMHEKYEQAGDGTAVKTVTSYWYDEYGNVKELEESGGSTGEVIKALIWYQDQFTSNHYLHAHPTKIEVYGNGKLLRRRTATYNALGGMESLTQHTGSGSGITSRITWDEYGNLKKITSQRGSWVEYGYEDDTHQYVSSIRQGGIGVGTYESRMEWDALWGMKTREEDENGQVMTYETDEYGRLKAIYSPYDQGGSVATVRYEYYTEAGKPWYAITRNKIRLKKDDQEVMTTVVMTDGLGRSLVTGKDGAVWNGNGSTNGWNISGAISYDGKGRVEAEGQNRFVAGSLENLLGYSFSEGLKNPSYRRYDSLDRVIEVLIPDRENGGQHGAPAGYVTMRTGYSIDKGAAEEKRTDPEGNRSIQRYDFRGNILSVTRLTPEHQSETDPVLTSGRYEYNGLGEMLSAYDHHDNLLEVSYDLLGRKTSIVSADMGRKEYLYNSNGDLSEETDTVLRSRGQRIQYQYDGLGRMTGIVYPSQTVSYTYGSPAAAGSNGAGRVEKVEDETGSIEYRYGKMGEVVEERRTIRLLPQGSGVEKTKTMQYLSDYLGRMEEITYPDGEVVRYEYDHGGQIYSVTGIRHGETYPYVQKIGYDEYGQRVYIQYGNGVETEYRYDEERRWLDSIKTTLGTSGGNTLVYQDMEYRFSAAGNIKGYVNDSTGYRTEQSYGYDHLYQLTKVTGKTISRSYGSTEYTAEYEQTYGFDRIGNMREKKSRSSATTSMVIGTNLNYESEYEYYEGYAHRAEVIGNRYYQYDGNGNVVAERDGGHAPKTSRGSTVYNEGDLYYTDYGFGLLDPRYEHGQADEEVYQRVYTWDERNLLRSSRDNRYTVQYRYGVDGQRAIKYVEQTGKTTLYYNNMWQMANDSAGWLQSKHIYVGETRLVTKRNYEAKEGYGDNLAYENRNQYYYHSDHLGSAQLVTDYQGNIYERLEYTPYGEVWIEKTANGVESLPFKFTGKEMDEETGLYYYGARYLDPKTSRWLSADPAMGEYVPSAPVNDEAKKRNGNLPGYGGVYNSINMHVYAYTHNNPIKYNDPDGRNPIVGSAAPSTLPGIGPSPVNPTIINFPNTAPALLPVLATIGKWALILGLVICITGDSAAPKYDNDERVALYRAVRPEEAESLISKKIFTVIKGLTGKYFSTTIEGAVKEGLLLSRLDKSFDNKDVIYTLFETTFPVDQITPDMVVTVDGDVSTIWIPTEKLIYLSPPTCMGTISETGMGK